MTYAEQALKNAFHPTPVREFHEVFGHPVSYDPTVVPAIDVRVLRVQMLASELVELARAYGVQLKVDSTQSKEEDKCVLCRAAQDATYDVIEAADALGDIRYITDGGNLISGFPGEAILAEIHRSNMSKLLEDGSVLRREDGKILKGPNYTKPDIRRVLFGTHPELLK